MVNSAPRTENNLQRKQKKKQKNPAATEANISRSWDTLLLMVSKLNLLLYLFLFFISNLLTFQTLPQNSLQTE